MWFKIWNNIRCKNKMYKNKFLVFLFLLHYGFDWDVLPSVLIFQADANNKDKYFYLKMCFPKQSD